MTRDYSTRSSPAAAAMTYDLESAKSSRAPIATESQSLGNDPLRRLENAMRWAVLGLAAAILLLSLAAAVAVAKVWLPGG